MDGFALTQWTRAAAADGEANLIERQRERRLHRLFLRSPMRGWASELSPPPPGP